MQIKERLRIHLFISLISAAVIIVILSLTVYRINIAMQEADLADQILTGSFERSTFRADYLRTGNERAKAQWSAKSREIAGLLKAASEKYRDGKDKKIVDEMIEDQESTEKLFSAIVENRSRLNAGLDPALSQEIERRLETQLTMRLYEKTLNTGALHESAKEHLYSTLKFAGWGIVFLIAAAAVAAIINSLSLRRTIDSRIQNLRDGAALIGGGDLEYRIDVGDDDEFAELSAAFNAMTARLQRSYRDLKNEIAERMRAEADLRKSEEKYRTLFSSIDEGFCIIEMVFEGDRPVDYLFLEMNPAFEKHTGLHQAVGRSVRELVPDHESYWFDIYGKIALTGEPARFVNEAKSLNRWYDVYAFRIVGQESRQVAVLFNDISESRKAEESLRQSEQRYRVLFENMLDGFAYCKMLFDEKGRTVDFIYLSVNASFYKLTGLSNVIGKRVTEVIPGVKESNPELFDIYGRVALTGRPEKFEIEVRPLEKWLSLSVYSTEKEYFVAVFDNITDRKRSEEALRQSEEALKNHVAELDIVNRELESFIYSISHDLRSPLRHISGLSQILVEKYSDKLDEEGRDFLVRNVNACKRMYQLTDDLLRLSRITHSEIKKEKVCLSPIAREIADRLSQAQPARKAEFVIADGLEIEADPDLTRILLDNLFENAWKFTGRTASARIEFGAVERDGELSYYVRDNGTGFDPQYASNLFRPFQRMHNHDDFPGSGIGLAIAHRIVSKHKGRIWAESEPGKGATFYFTL